MCAKKLMELLESALQCVTDEYRQLPDSDELINKIHHKFIAFYDDPKLTELSLLLGKELSLEEARQLIFLPSPDQIRFFFSTLFLLFQICIDFIHVW